MTPSQTTGDDPLHWLHDDLAALGAAGLQRTRQTVRPLPHGRCEIEGRELLNLASNDYLGLAADSRVITAAREALSDLGTGACASALLTGRTDLHQQLEVQLAEFEGTEAALLFPTGFAANVGVVSCLVGRGDVVCGDRLNHASLIDGCRLSGAAFRVYRHRAADHLERELRKHAHCRRRLIVTDGLFSMDGDVAPLPELCDVAERCEAMLLVDEAHATGVLGSQGRGVAEWLGVDERVPIRVGTLSKALGSQGGFVAGSAALIEWVSNQARPQIFSTALNPASCAAALAGLEILRDDLDRRQRLAANCRFLRQRLQAAGVPAEGAAESPIIPIILGSPEAARNVSSRLRVAGFYVPAIRPPSVPAGTSRLRISLTAEHQWTDLDQLAAALVESLPPAMLIDL